MTLIWIKGIYFTWSSNLQLEGLKELGGIGACENWWEAHFSRAEDRGISL